MQTAVIKKRHSDTFPGAVDKQETLTYSSTSRKKAANKQSNQHLIEGFTPRQNTQLDKETRNKMSFITFMINIFALTYKMNRQNAYLYLEKYGGLDFLFENWWALHTDNHIWAVHNIYEICYQNGGVR